MFVVRLAAATQVQAQTHLRPGAYRGLGNGTAYNPTTRTTVIPGVAVVKPHGVYQSVGNGYYRNQATGNIYNPHTRSYTSGRNMTFRPGGYQNMGNGTRYNPTTRATHIPGVAVIKPSGVYRAVGNTGYY